MRPQNGQVSQRPTGRTRWWSRARGLPAPTYASWVASLAERAERPPRILAWAASVGGCCIGSPGALSYQVEGGWRHVGWHEIEHGGWNAETSRLTWRTYEGGPATVELEEPGQLPELFRERVAASIAVEKFVALSGSRGVTITARRNLGTEAPIDWHSTLTRGLSWQTEGVREAVDVAMAELRTEYDLG